MYLSIMKGLPTLLLLCSTALLCSAAPAVEPVTCSEDGGAAAARMAAHHIDENHDHGYKFKLSEIKGNKVEKVQNNWHYSKYLLSLLKYGSLSSYLDSIKVQMLPLL